jgi:NAD(P)-dependent dehydrogenase (short-subunit alcohol dehydrogenase family)
MTFAEDCLQGQHILVTGASSGLGRATAVAVAGCGARVSLVGRSAARLDETLALLKGEGHSAHEADLSDAEAASDSVSAIISERGTLNGAFYSAGTTLVLPAKLQKNRHLDDVFGAGLRGAFGLVRALLKKNAMVDGGSMVFMSSFSAVRGRQGMTAYCAAKAGLDGMVRALALEVAARRIRVNSIVAGAVETAMHERILEGINEEAIEDYRSRHPLGFGQPDDVANAALFLLSDASKWITGSAMAVDGGAAA